MEMNKNTICSIMDMAYYMMMDEFKNDPETGEISMQHGYIINATKICEMCVEENYHVYFSDHAICEDNGFKSEMECIDDEIMYIFDSDNNYIGCVNDFWDVIPNEIWIDGKLVENNVFYKYEFLENE